MGDLVHNALRRKLAAAEAAGDVERVDRIRRTMGTPSTRHKPVAEVAPIVEPTEVAYVTELEPETEWAPNEY